MLTKAEKDWLELRDFCKALVDRFYCLNCQDFFTDDEEFETVCLNPNNCPITTQDFRDAAEFEARVARELSDPTGGYIPLCMPDDCDFHDRHNCRACRLMFARIAVEQEMEREGR